MAVQVPIGFEELGQESEQSKQFRGVSYSEANNELDQVGRDYTVRDKMMKDDDGDEEDDSVYFRDGVRRIDYVLTFERDVPEDKKWSAEDLSERQKKREMKRAEFLDNLEAIGIEHEVEQPKANSSTYFVKLHAKFSALEKGAEDLLLKMPIKPVDLPRVDLPWYRSMFESISVTDPFSVFEPKIPDEFKRKDYFTAPFSIGSKKKFIGIDKEDSFFSSAQRIAIVYYLMEQTKYADEDDQIGISRLLQNKSFSAAYPLHDGSFRFDKDKEVENERQLLFREWSHPRNWYKYQPLDNIRHYFGEKIGLYFAWIGFYTYWLLWASIVGIIIFIGGLYTIATSNNPIAKDICEEDYREYFYMCPLCDETCDFWYYRAGCAFSHLSLLFDYGGTVFFAAFMALWAVLFLEFWKRREAFLQYHWDTLGYEEAEERERPEFIQKIKRKIRNCSEEEEKKYKVYNPVLERDEYIQPAHHLIGKLSAAFSVSLTLVVAVIGIVIAVLVYRLAVSSIFYRGLRNLPGGPSAADLITSITGSMIQLVAIIIMNQIYERLALKFTKWELQRTNTEYEDSFTYKMYLFQFVNFYSSLFYIAFFKGNVVGFPGSFIRLGSYRLDECPTYGCLFELSIQLIVIFVGKQILNNVLELGKPYAIKLIKMFVKEKKEKDKPKTRWEKDLAQIPISAHGLFFEYIELVIQYGFVTIFVAAFPLAPFFAWLNNIIEIRLDAHKYIQILRRPVAERAQDIGAWFYLLNFTTNLSVITNAFLIAITSRFIDIEMFNRVYQDNPVAESDCSFDDPSSCATGLMAWSTSPFQMSSLLSPINDKTNDTFFPYLSILSLEAYVDGEVAKRDGESILYLPFIDFGCLRTEMPSSNYTHMYNNFTLKEFQGYYSDEKFQDLTLRTYNQESDRPISSNYGQCFIDNTTCRFRDQVDADGEHPAKYWRTYTAKLAFVIVFEHVIFLIGIMLDLLIPDIPKSVKNEIRREKFLAAKMAIEEKKENKKKPDEDQ